MRFATARQPYERNCHLFLIVYDVTRKDSFDDVESQSRETDRFTHRANKIIVGASPSTSLDEGPLRFEGLNARNAGNKIDQRGLGNTAISREQGEALAAKLGLPYFEVSVKTCVGLDGLWAAVHNQASLRCCIRIERAPDVVQVPGASASASASSGAGGRLPRFVRQARRPRNHTA